MRVARRTNSRFRALSTDLTSETGNTLPTIELIPLYEPESTARRKPKALQQKDAARAATMLDQFVSRPRGDSEWPGPGEEDVVMNEDGTMTM